MSEREKKLEAMGYAMDVESKPAATYKPLIIDGNTIYTSGQIPVDGGQVVSKGSVPSQVSLEDAQKAAALCVVNGLRAVRKSVGSIDKIARVIRLTVFVNSDAGFTDQHLVANGASQLMLDVFGDSGWHARSAVGVAELPLGCSVEVEMIFKLAE
ncbi:MAG: RidA family protein [Phycisphaera sp.]|nr:RidA family protein [Phycisphaera sp.]